MKGVIATLFILVSTSIQAQDNPVFSNPVMEQILSGDYDPVDYDDPNALMSPTSIYEDVEAQMSADSLERYLTDLTSFFNRNTGADTLSATEGVGAARNFILEELQNISTRRKGRLVTGFYQFDREICEITRHKNVIGILPGIGADREEFILLEAHYDSRCEDRCGIDCQADGADDNGSGTALVMELARVLSKYKFNRSIIFMLTTGEEQGLVGARSFAEYCFNNGINIRAVYNNDVVGGIICGETASPPGCPGLNEIDSVNLRVYSANGNGSIHKGLARFVKMQYEDEMAQYVNTPTQVRLMSAEDRTGRGGDHIPFRELGYPAIRFTEANEHGNGNPSTPDYADRQHSVRDVIGEDTNGDGVIDEYYVDFNYLRRNALVNAAAIVSTAAGPATPASVDLTEIPGGFVVRVNDPDVFDEYRIGVRRLTSGPEFDTVFTIDAKLDTIIGIPRFFYYISVASVDSIGIESIFTQEERLSVPSFTKELPEEIEENAWELQQNTPNPFDEATWIRIIKHREVPYKEAFLVITDMKGQPLTKIRVDLREKVTEVLYDYAHHNYEPGVYAYSLVIDGVRVDTKRMIYAY